jgi:hypothetical protein
VTLRRGSESARGDRLCTEIQPITTKPVTFMVFWPHIDDIEASVMFGKRCNLLLVIGLCFHYAYTLHYVNQINARYCALFWG